MQTPPVPAGSRYRPDRDDAGIFAGMGKGTAEGESVLPQQSHGVHHLFEMTGTPPFIGFLLIPFQREGRHDVTHRNQTLHQVSSISPPWVKTRKAMSLCFQTAQKCLP